MKPLTILLATVVAVSMLAFSAGSVGAGGGGHDNEEWRAIRACVKDCKVTSCKELLRHDRVICNHSCWCECSGLCEGAKVCLDKMLTEETRCEVAGGIAVPGEGFTLCTGIQKPILGEGLIPIDEIAPLTLPFRFYLKVDGNFTGMPVSDEEILCDIKPFEADVVALRVNSDEDGCPVMEDTDPEVLDLAFLAYDPEDEEAIIVLDPDGEDVYVEDLEAQIEACVEKFTGVALTANSNPCPAELLCCREEFGPYRCIDIVTEDVVDCQECDDKEYLYDNDNDYGLDACEFEGEVGIDYADCPFEIIRKMTADQKMYALTATFQLLPEIPSLVRNIVDDGKLVKLDREAYEFNTTLNCLIDEAEGFFYE